MARRTSHTINEEEQINAGEAENPRQEQPTAEQFGHLFDDGLGGFESMNAATISLPFIRLLQDLSLQVKKNKPEYVEGAEPGLFINTVTNDLYDAPLRMVVGRFDRYYIEWKPNRGGFVMAHSVEVVEQNLSQGTLRIGDKNKIFTPTGNTLQDTYVYLVILPDYIDQGVCMFSLTSTQLKEARRWNRLLSNLTLPNGQRALPYYAIWDVNVVGMSNDQGDWYGIKVNFSSWVDVNTFSKVKEARAALPPSTSIDLRALEDPHAPDEEKGEGRVAF